MEYFYSVAFIFLRIYVHFALFPFFLQLLDTNLFISIWAGAYVSQWIHDSTQDLDLHLDLWHVSRYLQVQYYGSLRNLT